jgi:hypothetical protein
VKESILEDGFFKTQFLNLQENMITVEGFGQKSVPLIHSPGSDVYLFVVDDENHHSNGNTHTLEHCSSSTQYFQILSLAFLDQPAMIWIIRFNYCEVASDF